MNTFESEYHNHTTVHPVGLIALIVLGVVLLGIRRQYAVLPILIVACFIPSAQRIVVLGIDFDFIRIMVLFGLIRVLSHGETEGFRWVSMDTLVVAWALVGTLFPILRTGGDVLVNRLGMCFDVLGMYFLFRVLVKDSTDFRTAIGWLMLLSLPVAAFMLVERSTGRNVFSVLGGVPELTVVRDGRLRCQGAFAHPILAGAFWAAALPLAVSQWWGPDRNKTLVVLSFFAMLFIIVASASSTPIFGVLTAVIGAALFRARRYVRMLRWALLFLIVGLHMIMKAPVWHLISRVSAVGGDSGWHRFSLVDGFITHWDEWWLIGSSIGSAHWGHFTFDVTNYYIVQGLHGGILQLALWIAIIALGFAYVGRLLATFDRVSRAEVILSWSMGVSLLVHAVNHFGVSYFGQIWLGWYLIIGAIGSLYAASLGAAQPLDGGISNTRPQLTLRRPLL